MEVVDAANPLIVQADRSIYLKTFGPCVEEARAAILPFAELEKCPERPHRSSRYRALELRHHQDRRPTTATATAKAEGQDGDGDHPQVLLLRLDAFLSGRTPGGVYRFIPISRSAGTVAP